MPIIDFQRKMRQLGEIRIGHVVDTGRISERTGKPILRPEKLDKFRFTSASRPMLEQIAELYGGTVQEWTPANGGPKEWEVYSEVDRVPVIVPPINNVIDSWFEQYKGSKCARRCDGQVEQKSDQPCICRANWGENWRETAPARERCQITTRLNVMLRDVRGLGVWLLTTHGFYATSELPAMAETLLRARGEIPGFLTMEEKVVPLDDGVARFMVPKLDVDLTPGQLFAGASSAAVQGGQQAAAVNGGQAPAVEAGRAAIEAPTRTAEEFIQAAAECADLGQLTNALREANAAGFAKGDDEVWKAFAAARARLTQPAIDEKGEPEQGEDARAKHIKASFRARTMDDLTAALNAAQADGFCTDLNDETDDVTAAFLARRRVLDPPKDTGQQNGDRDALWAQIVAAWPGDKTSEIEDALNSDYDVTPATATADQLARFLADVHAGTVKPAQAESGVPF